MFYYYILQLYVHTIILYIYLYDNIIIPAGFDGTVLYYNNVRTNTGAARNVCLYIHYTCTILYFTGSRACV